LSIDPHKSRYGRICDLVDIPTLAAKSFSAIGAGSAGQPIIEQMARHGVGSAPDGRIRIVDGDHVSARNLIGTNYRQAHIGAPKAEAAARIVREINDKTNVTYWNRHLDSEDLPTVIQMARESHLLGLFADSFDLILQIANQCHDLCPQAMVVFGPRADYAEVGFSIPGLTPRLSTTMGKRTRQTIQKPQALGCDTSYIANFVAALCLHLLQGDAKGNDLLQCFSDAPLYVVGLRPSWIFEHQPDDIVRSIVCVGTHKTLERKTNHEKKTDTRIHHHPR